MNRVRVGDIVIENAQEYRITAILRGRAAHTQEYDFALRLMAGVGYSFDFFKEDFTGPVMKKLWVKSR